MFRRQEERTILVPFSGPGSLGENALLQKFKDEGWIVMSAYLHTDDERGQMVSMRLVRNIEEEEQTREDEQTAT